MQTLITLLIAFGTSWLITLLIGIAGSGIRGRFILIDDEKLFHRMLMGSIHVTAMTVIFLAGYALYTIFPHICMG